MPKNLNRRSILLAGVGVAGALALAGCATTSIGKVTTVTLNVAKIAAYADAGLNAVSTVTDALVLFPGLAAYTAPLQAVESILQVALTNFTAAAGSNVTVVYDDTNIKTAVDSVLSAIQSIASQVATIILAMAKQTALGLSDKTVSKVQLAHDALSTIIAVFQALLSSTVSTPVAMSETQALRVLRA